MHVCGALIDTRSMCLDKSVSPCITNLSGMSPRDAFPMNLPQRSRTLRLYLPTKQQPTPVNNANDQITDKLHFTVQCFYVTACTHCVTTLKKN